MPRDVTTQATGYLKRVIPAEKLCFNCNNCHSESRCVGMRNLKIPLNTRDTDFSLRFDRKCIQKGEHISKISFPHRESELAGR